MKILLFLLLSVSIVHGQTTTNATHGGTNQTTWTLGDLLYANGTNTLAKLGIGTTGYVLTVVGGVPAWAAASGGGGLSGLTTNGVLYAASSTTAASTAAGTAAQFLTGGTPPVWGATLLNANITTTYTNGLVLTNTTASTSSVKVQQSPSLQFLGHGWSTTATAADTTRAWDITDVPTTAALAASSLIFRAGNGGTNMGEVFAITSAGAFRINGSAPGGGIASFSSSGVLGSYFGAPTLGQVYFGGTSGNGYMNTAQTFWYDGTNKRLGIGGGINNAASYTLHAWASDAATNAISTVVGIDHSTSGTPAAGYGSQILMLGQSSTTVSQNMGAISWDWVVATHASRESEEKHWGVFNASSLTDIGTWALTGASTGTLTVGKAGTTLGNLALTGNTSGTITLTGAAAAGTYTLTLPTSGGTKGYQLQTDGAGVTSWRTPVTYQATPADPAATTSATVVMAGLAGTITPTGCGTIQIIISGTIKGANSNQTYHTQIYYGTGTAPTNAAAETGTLVGNLITLIDANIAGAQGMAVPFTANAIITGLTPSTAYWIDLGSKSAAGSVTLTGISISAFEF